MIDLLQLVLPAIRNVVGNQTFEYRTYVGYAPNEMGISVPRYTEWITCDGSVQPMDASNYEQFGLDSAKNGILVWGSINLNTVDVQDHADQVRYDGRIFNCDRVTKWHLANGWNSFACTEDKRERKDRKAAENKTIVHDDGAEVQW